jgi:hypothetical protein
MGSRSAGNGGQREYAQRNGSLVQHGARCEGVNRDSPCEPRGRTGARLTVHDASPSRWFACSAGRDASSDHCDASVATTSVELAKVIAQAALIVAALRRHDASVAMFFASLRGDDAVFAWPGVIHRLAVVGGEIS